MRELAVLPLASVPDSGGLADVVYLNATEAPNDVSFRRKVGGAWRDVAETITISGPPTPLRVAEATPVLSGDYS